MLGIMRSTAWVLPTLMTAFACSPGEGSAGSTGGTGAATGSSASTGGDGAAGAAAQELEDCGSDSPPTSDSRRCLLSVTGRAVDENGEAIADELVSVCGPVCFNGDADGEGEFSVVVGRYVDVAEFSVSVHGRPRRGVFYFQLPEPGNDGFVDVGDQLSLALPEAGSEFDRNGGPEQALESGGVELVVPEGVEVKLDPEDILAGSDGSQFRARLVPEEHYASLGLDDADFDALYALGPFEAWLRDAETSEPVAAQLSFPNPGLEPGAAVDVLALGSYIYPDWVAPAAFEVVATATVTEDAERVVLDEGEGVDYLTWIALRQSD